MTTNERMNMSRYTHFHTNRRGIYNSPFDRGVWQNFVDFADWRFFGFLRPIKDDWMNRFDIHDRPGGDKEPLLKVV
jgi:hypothetical protein